MNLPESNILNSRGTPSPLALRAMEMYLESGCVPHEYLQRFAPLGMDSCVRVTPEATIPHDRPANHDPRPRQRPVAPVR